MRLCPVGATILDVGVSRYRPGKIENYFLNRYHREPSTYTGLGIEDLSMLEAMHPGKRFLRYDGRIFPFRDKEFDWVHCNAVIEHVGDEAAQRLFLSEMLRVSKSVYFTTPNRYFPIEAHTGLWFTHWSRERFERWMKARKRRMPIRLLSASELHVMLEQIDADFRIQKNRMLGWPMTLSVIARKAH
jgi:hypothetical protein